MLKLLIISILSLQLFANTISNEELSYAYLISMTDKKKSQINEVKSILEKYKTPTSKHIEAMLLFKGKYFKQNKEKAIKLFKENKTHGPSLYQLSRIYKKDKDKYIGYSLKAARLKHPEAMYQIAIYHVYSKKDKEKGYKLMKLARKYGSENALAYIKHNIDSIRKKRTKK